MNMTLARGYHAYMDIKSFDRRNINNQTRATK